MEVFKQTAATSNQNAEIKTNDTNFEKKIEWHSKHPEIKKFGYK
jgi:hypothetical protein